MRTFFTFLTALASISIVTGMIQTIIEQRRLKRKEVSVDTTNLNNQDVISSNNQEIIQNNNQEILQEQINKNEIETLDNNTIDTIEQENTVEVKSINDIVVDNYNQHNITSTIVIPNNNIEVLMIIHIIMNLF